MTSTGFCKIENKGEVDINSFRLLGASTKEGDDSKIGFFGSGIKYALASVLREDIPIRVFSGEKEIKITTRRTTMRDMDFDVICINGTPTSLTTRMGKDWKPWFIFREFYCNALDEGDAKVGVTDTPKGEAGRTTIYLGMTPSMREVLDNFDQFFSFKREPNFKIGNARVYRRLGDEMSVYRKGIRTFSGHQSLYDYDFVTGLSINEARESSDYDVNCNVASLWKRFATPEMISALVNSRSSWELDTMNWSYGMDFSLSRHWKESLKGKVIIPAEYGGHFVDDLSTAHVLLPHKLCEILHAHFGNDLTIRGFESGKKGIVVIPATDRQRSMTEAAKNFLLRAGLADASKFPIHVAELERHQYGRAEDGAVYLSPTVFEQGAREVTKTLLEEVVHLRSLASDRTRAMQEELLNMIVVSYEERLNEYL